MGLVEQIRSEQLRLGWSTQQLLDRSGLALERSTLSRKLRGETPMTDAECEALAAAMALTLTWPKRRRTRNAAA
jgi:transcriptional regulator with XRE-family HTH domain